MYTDHLVLQCDEEMYKVIYSKFLYTTLPLSNMTYSRVGIIKTDNDEDNENVQ